MLTRPLFSPGSFSPYRPPSLALIIVSILVGLGLASVPAGEYIDARRLESAGVPATGRVVGFRDQVRYDGRVRHTRRYIERTVSYVFDDANGQSWHGDIVRPKLRTDALPLGKAIPVYYEEGTPAHNIAADEIDYRLRWRAIPAALGLMAWLSIQLLFLRQNLRWAG